MGGVGFFAAGAIVGRGVGVGVGRDHGQRTGFDFSFGAATVAAGASINASSARVAKNFMNGKNRR